MACSEPKYRHLLMASKQVVWIVFVGVGVVLFKEILPFGLNDRFNFGICGGGLNQFKYQNYHNSILLYLFFNRLQIFRKPLGEFKLFPPPVLNSSRNILNVLKGLRHWTHNFNLSYPSENCIDSSSVETEFCSFFSEDN